MKVTKRTKLSYACELARNGLYILPVKPMAKTPLTAWKNGGPGEQATTDLKIIAQWWATWPDANIAIATGPSKLLVVDVDVKKGKEGRVAYMMLDLEHGSIPRTLQVRTPSRGWHDYFKVDTLVPGTTNLLKDTIGTGIDIKCADGYVLGPGSELPEGKYQWVDARVPIACASSELVDLLTPQFTDVEPIESGSSTPEQLADMLAWLDPTDFKDHDEWLRLMCACHHATGGAGVEEFVEWSTSDPEYAEDDEQIRYRWGTLGKKSNKTSLVTERTLIKYVLEAGGEVPGEDPRDDFSVVVEATALPNRFLTLDQIKRMQPASWLIDGFMPEHSFCILYGAPGTFKTFFGLHGALSVANGKEFFGRRVRQGSVFYLAGESPAGFRLRVAAWERHFGYVDVCPPFYLQPGGAVLNRDGEAEKLARDILAVSTSPKLIVVDTLQVYMEGNENSPEYMGSFVRACLDLREKTGAAVLVIHHLGKDTSKGARGHTSLAGTADAMFEMAKQGELGLLRCTKMKEAADQFSITVQPLRVVVDADGEFEDSLILTESATVVELETTKIRELAKGIHGQAQKELVEILMRELKLSKSSAQRKIKEAIPEGEDNAIWHSDGYLWLQPDPRNPRGGKTVSFKEEVDEKSGEDDEPEWML